jgi:catechol 2,3-dioxygenase-like lactoylglutathione lyase family enzyme
MLPAMTVMRVERVVYGVPNLDECVRFFEDFGLLPVDDDGRAGEQGARFTTQTGQVIELRPIEALDALAAGLITDRKVWTDAEGTVHAVDQTGWGVGLTISRPVPADPAYSGAQYPGANRSGAVARVNRPLDPPGRVRPLRLCHVALDIPKPGKEEAVAFYTGRLGFVPTDRVAKVGVFMRAPGDTDHHTLLLCHRPDRAGINHCAYEVARVDEVIVGANDMIEKGWHEARRLGRHTVGSNIFRFISAPCGGRVEFAADMDRVDENYGPYDHEETPPHTIWTLKLQRDSQEGDH